MSTCDSCLPLHGRPAYEQGRHDLALIGIGDCNGERALEHYRCAHCGSALERRLMGAEAERIWTVFDFPGKYSESARFRKTT
jgi:hypothetical protein